jgi:APA family basic amino acid/polyamine antiporter
MKSWLLRTKPMTRIMADTEVEGHKLRRALTAWDLTAIGIGCIIGVGIFVLPGVQAANNAGPGIILSFAIASFACACSALCYAELAAMIPVSGSAYTYGYATLGEIFAWIIGWDLILE